MGRDETKSELNEALEGFFSSEKIRSTDEGTCKNLSFGKELKKRDLSWKF